MFFVGAAAEITESQNVRDWNGPWKIIRSNPPASEGRNAASEGEQICRAVPLTACPFCGRSSSHRGGTPSAAWYAHQTKPAPSQKDSRVVFVIGCNSDCRIAPQGGSLSAFKDFRYVQTKCLIQGISYFPVRLVKRWQCLAFLCVVSTRLKGCFWKSYCLLLHLNLC